jgi:hypothetical protein
MSLVKNSGSNTPRDLSGNKARKFQNGWTSEQETLLAKWSDYASCYRWLHDRTEKKLSAYNNAITIPVIILSTVTGTASVGLTGLVGDIPDGQKYGQISIGIVSLFTAILTTLGNFFRYAQNSEAHRVSAVSWGKFNRLIAVELAQKPDDRMDSLDFISLCRQDLDRLIEQSPQIPDDVIQQFEKEFEHEQDLERPDICNNLEHTSVYNNSKERMKQMVAEMALNLKHKKKVLREELLPDLETRMKAMIDKSIKEYEERMNNQRKEDDKYGFLRDVRKKLNEFVETVGDIHVSEVNSDISKNSVEGPHITVDVVGSQRNKIN